MTSTTRRRGSPGRGGVASAYPPIVAAAAGAFLLLGGVWAMVAPRSFFDVAATFEPYNQHLIQDIGAFQIGLGAVLLLTWWARDALVVGLTGVSIGSAAHVVSHVVGHDLGGTPEVDIPFFTVMTVLLLSAAVVRYRQTRRVPPRR